MKYQSTDRYRQTFLSVPKPLSSAYFESKSTFGGLFCFKNNAFNMKCLGLKYRGTHTVYTAYFDRALVKETNR